MAAPFGWVTFTKKPPEVQEIADRVSKLTGLDVRVDQGDILNEPSIAFEAIPEERIAFRTLQIPHSPEGCELLKLDYATAGGTLIMVTRIALESLGGDRFSFIPKVSKNFSRKYGGKTTVDQLLRRHRWEEFRMNFILRPMGYAIGGCFIVALLLGGAFVHHDPQKLRRKTS